MAHHLPHALPPDSEPQNLVKIFDSLSISVNRDISVTGADSVSASHTVEPGPLKVPHCPSDGITSAAISAPTTLPHSRGLPALTVTVSRPRAVSSPSACSPAINISVQSGAAGDLEINIAYSRPRSRSIATSPPQASQSFAAQTSSQPSDNSLIATPTTSGISSSTRLSASSKPTSVRCSGLRKSPNNPGRCDKPVKRMPLALIHPDDVRLEEEGLPHYCSHHKDQEIIPLHFSPPKPSSSLVTFADWIPEYLTNSTQAALRFKMAEPPSSSDGPGYVYAFEVLDPSFRDQTKLHLKVGYTEDLPKRMDQWQKKCHSNKHILHGHWPGGLVDDPQDTEDGNDVSASEAPGPKGPLCHLVERLVHLELADLVVNKQYFDPDFTLPKKPDILSRPQIAPKSAAGKLLFPRQQCIGCGVVHREIFAFERVRKGVYKGKEWDSIIKPVIEKWGAFVKAYIQDE